MTPFRIRSKLKAALQKARGGGSDTGPKAPVRPSYTVRFELPDGTSYEVEAKEQDSLVLASGRGARPISTGCADGTCSTCQVEVIAGGDQLTPPDEHEAKTKTENNVDPARRLGCQAGVMGPGVHVRIINVLGEDLVED